MMRSFCLSVISVVFGVFAGYHLVNSSANNQNDWQAIDTTMMTLELEPDSVYDAAAKWLI